MRLVEIEIGEWVRLEGGYFFKVTEKQPAHGDETGSCSDCVKGANYESAFLDEIKKHNKDLLELIEKGDILEVYVPNTDNILKTEVKDEFKDTLIYNAVKNRNLKIKSVLTKEQYEENSFKVGE